MRASSSRDSFSNRRNSAMYCWRVERAVDRQERNALCAASIASQMSSRVEDWKKARLLPRSAGFSFPNVVPLREAFHSPSTKLLKVWILSLSATDISTPPKFPLMFPYQRLQDSPIVA